MIKLRFRAHTTCPRPTASKQTLGKEPKKETGGRQEKELSWQESYGWGERNCPVYELTFLVYSTGGIYPTGQ